MNQAATWRWLLVRGQGGDAACLAKALSAAFTGSLPDSARTT